MRASKMNDKIAWNTLNACLQRVQEILKIKVYLSIINEAEIAKRFPTYLLIRLRFSGNLSLIHFYYMSTEIYSLIWLCVIIVPNWQLPIGIKNDEILRVQDHRSRL